jgi:phospholipase C
MHPNSAVEAGFGKGRVGSVLLGEKLVFDVYEAVRNLPKATRDRTLLVITFDEHGGCYDHVVPPGFGYWTSEDGATLSGLDPQEVTAPDLTGYVLQDGFDFRMLGVRVPTIMVSSHIARNTVVKSPMDHSSFARTVGKKWDAMAPGKFPLLTARVRDALEFTEVFTLDAPRDDWPVLSEPAIPPESTTRDASQDPLGRLERSIVDGVSALPQLVEARKRGAGALLQDPATITTVGEAERYFSEVKALLAAGA